MATPLTQPTLTGKKIFLRPATAEDITNTYHWFLLSEPQSQTCHPVIFRSAAEAAEEFKKKERSIDRQAFMIVRREDKTPVGKVSFFNYNPLNRSAELGLLVDPDERRKGYGKEGMRLLIDFLFDYRGLNRVYFSTAAFNQPMIKLAEALHFKREGTLRDHYYYNASFCEGYIFGYLSWERGR